MTYFGKPVDNSPTAPPPLRRFTFKTWGGRPREIEADGVVFGPAHVQFWRNQEGRASSLLVEAVPNTSVIDLKEEPHVPE